MQGKSNNNSANGNDADEEAEGAAATITFPMPTIRSEEELSAVVNTRHGSSGGPVMHHAATYSGTSPFTPSSSTTSPHPRLRASAGIVASTVKGAMNLGLWAVRSFAHTTRSLMLGSSGNSPNPPGDRSEGVSGHAEAQEAVSGGATEEDPERQLRHEANEKIRTLAHDLVTAKQLRISVCTWNVSQQPPPEDDLRKWLIGDPAPATEGEAKSGAPLGQGGDEAASSLPDVVVAGLQEVEFGGAALMLEVTESSVVWFEAITDCLHKASQWKIRYKKVKTVQLVGMTLIVIARAAHEPFIRHVKTAVTRTGAMKGVMGNKGAIGLRATIYSKRILFICAHFHAHAHNEKLRSRNYHDALSELKFYLPPDADDELDVVDAFNVAAAPRKYIDRRAEGSSTWSRLFTRKCNKDVALGNELRILDSHDYVFFFGDLNFRLSNLSRKEIDSLIAGRQYAALIQHDELHAGMATHRMFDGFEEPQVTFPPTYKFDIGTDVYDTSSKQRDPAYTDRILFRALTAAQEGGEDSQSVSPQSGSATTTQTTSSTPQRADGVSPLIDAPPFAGRSESFGKAVSVDELATMQRRSTENPLSLHHHGRTLSSSSSVHRTPRFEFVPNNVEVLSYDSCRALRSSDHRPVSAQFRIQVLYIESKALSNFVYHLRQLFDEKGSGLNEDHNI